MAWIVTTKRRFSAFLLCVLVVPFCCLAQSRVKRCARQCRCYPANKENGVDVDCGGRRLTDLPSMPKNAITLAMQDNHLLQLIPRSFGRSKSLQNIYLYNNRIQRVHWDAFKGLGNLKILSLFNNSLTLINNGTFRFLTSLEKLYLYLNKLETLNRKSFVGLSSLKLLSLRDNRLTTIEPGTFTYLGELDSLFLFRNNLAALTSGMFQGLSSLKTLLIGFNKISKIENGAFRGLTSLTELFIDNNELDRIGSRMFADLISLKKLHLFNNAIKQIDPGSFFRLRELTHITAHHNKIDRISRGTLAGLVSLKSLYLHANRITGVDAGSFVDLKLLKSLYLYQNKISKISKEAFAGLDDLKQLHLGFNMITEIEDDAFVELKKLTTLYLDSNKLTRISKRTFAGVSSLLDLYVYFNHISYVHNNAFQDNKLLRHIAWDVPRVLRNRPKYRNATGNHLYCDCHVKYIKRWLSKHTTFDISCFEPSAFRHVSLRNILKTDLDKCHEPRVKTHESHVVVLLGQSATLRCTGKTSVEYLWYRNGLKILQSEGVSVSSFGTLSLANVKASDEGVYVCVGKSKEGFAMATTTLTVGYKPQFTRTSESTEVVIGSTLKLACQAEAKPPPKVLWRKSGQEVYVDEKRVFLTSGNTLIVLDVEEADDGIYTCEAWNEFSLVTNDVDVTVKYGTKTKTEDICQLPASMTATPIVPTTDMYASGSGEENDDEGNDDGDDGDYGDDGVQTFSSVSDATIVTRDPLELTTTPIQPTSTSNQSKASVQ